MVLFLFIAAIIAINYFKGQLYLCDNIRGSKSITDKWGCLNFGGDWKNSYLNFDNVPEAMATMFVIFNSV
jgi:hypothetical protein